MKKSRIQIVLWQKCKLKLKPWYNLRKSLRKERRRSAKINNRSVPNQ